MSQLSGAIFSILEKHIGEFRIRSNEAVAKTCPFCHGGDHGDEYSFAVSLYSGAFNCKRGGCGKAGSFRELCHFFGESPPSELSVGFQKKEKQYILPDPSVIKPRTEKIDAYFASRGISEETLNAFKIGADENGNILFPFYENGVLSYVKIRKPQKFVKGQKDPKEWAIKDGKPILFGMDNASFNAPLYITEGQIDAMSLYEAGIHNAVSVPSGCTDLRFIETCWNWLEGFSQIIIFGDNDEPGIGMINTLMKRLGEDRCLIAPAYPKLVVNGHDFGRDCKDANEILYAYGRDGLNAIAKACEPAPIKGILNLSDVPDINPLSIPRVYTRIPELDNAIAGLAEGGVTVFTGKRGEGKSTLTGSLLLNAIDQGKTVCAYSGELSASKFREWIFLQATESKYVDVTSDERTGKQFSILSPAVRKRISDWIDGKFFLFDNAYASEKEQHEAILNMFTICARRYGCTVFLVDNLMSALTSPDEENKAQARFTAALKAFAVKFKAHVILVAHPRKTKTGESITNDDVSGSSVITNLADNVISVEKPNIRVTKNREFGSTPFIECCYDPLNRRIYQASTGDRTVYRWNHEGITEANRTKSQNDAFAIQSGVPQYNH